MLVSVDISHCLRKPASEYAFESSPHPFNTVKLAGVRRYEKHSEVLAQEGLLLVTSVRRVVVKQQVRLFDAWLHALLQFLQEGLEPSDIGGQPKFKDWLLQAKTYCSVDCDSADPPSV